MNNSFFQPQNNVPNQGTVPPYINYFPSQAPEETVSDLLNKNVDIVASFYMSYPDSIEWRDQVFTGKIKSATREYFLLENGTEWYILWAVYINYILFTEEANRPKL